MPVSTEFGSTIFGTPMRASELVAALGCRLSESYWDTLKPARRNDTPISTMILSDEQLRVSAIKLRRLLRDVIRLVMDKDTKRARRRAKVGTATEIIAEIVGQRSQNEPPLQGPSWPKSEFDKLCEQDGGPANLGVTVDEHTFRRNAGTVPSSSGASDFSTFTPDEILARRHWPWAAFAINQYNFEINERARYTDELNPEENLRIDCTD